MPSPYYLLVSGRFVVVGKAPDGDSVRFVADDGGHYQRLRRGHRVHPSGDGGVQLRFEAIDAPELHYGADEQRLGRAARDRLLEKIGFQVQYDPADRNKVATAEPEYVKGAILSTSSDPNGRPVSYVLVGPEAAGLNDGDWVAVHDRLLSRTLNFWLLAEGLAYYLVYTSTPESHRGFFRDVAASVRREGAGVWGSDETSEFILRGQESIGPSGQLIFPKLFRRCTDYLKHVQRGFQGTLVDWLVKQSRGPANENDAVVAAECPRCRLSDLIEHQGTHVKLHEDLLDLAFVEK
jgi:endonuclease YncB( thermonuclease family)